MGRYNTGDWVKFRHRGITHKAQKVLEVRPDGVLVVGAHDNDPEPMNIYPDNVVEKL